MTNPSVRVGDLIRFETTTNEALVLEVDGTRSVKIRYTKVNPAYSIVVGSALTFDPMSAFDVFSDENEPAVRKLESLVLATPVPTEDKPFWKGVFSKMPGRESVPEPAKSVLQHDFSNPYLVNNHSKKRECVNCGTVDAVPGKILPDCVLKENRLLEREKDIFAMTQKPAKPLVPPKPPELAPGLFSYGHLMGGPERWR